MGSGTKLVCDLLGDHPEGLTRAQICASLRERFPHLSQRQIDRAITDAGDALVERGGFLFSAQDLRAEHAPTLSTDSDSPQRLLRVIAFDIESVVRLTTEEPYTQARMFQLGAVRFGPDREWVRAERDFNGYQRLPAEAEQLLEKPSVRQRYLERAEPANVVLSRFADYAAEADVLVAYNGTGLDFPLLDMECDSAAIPRLSKQRRVDGLYLALALWPVPPRQHRLYQLIERLRIDVGEARWHDALDDAKVLSVLINYGSSCLAE